MKVLLTTDTIGGVWNFSLSLARALPFEFHFATMGRKLSPAQRLEISDFPFDESEFLLEWMPGAFSDSRAGVDRAGEWLLSLERKIEPNILHHNTVTLAHLPFQAPSLVTLHSCVLSWWEAVKGENAPAEWDQYRQRVQRSLQAATKVVAPSAALLRTARQLYHLGNAGMVIGNFAKRTQLQCTKEPFVFAAGRAWDQAKNMAALQRVAPRLPWPVHLAGEGTTLGHLDAAEIDRWYARASIYAWPAKYEPFGLSVLEAAQHGCALVLGDIPSLRENWDGAAHFVRDDEQLFRAIDRFIGDSELRQEFAERARERSWQFQADITAQAYGAAYTQVLSGVPCAS